jgi:hypothetical protein
MLEEQLKWLWMLLYIEMWHHVVWENCTVTSTLWMEAACWSKMVVHFYQAVWCVTLHKTVIFVIAMTTWNISWIGCCSLDSWPPQSPNPILLITVHYILCYVYASSVKQHWGTLRFSFHGPYSKWMRVCLARFVQNCAVKLSKKHTQRALVKTEDLYYIILYMVDVPAFKKTTDVNFNL